jgi:uncharacterized membrane protein YbhN (UPF0104 family)
VEEKGDGRVEAVGPITAFNFYFFAFNATVIYQVHILRRLGHKYGFLDALGR